MDVLTSESSVSNTSDKMLKVKLRGLLDNRKFIELNKALANLDTNFRRNIKNEYKLFIAFDTFNLPDESYSSLFDSWVKATPESYIPYVARAKYYYAIAWMKRGGRFSNITAEKNMRSMRVYLEKVSADIQKALSLSSDSIIAHEIILNVAKSRGAEVEAEAVLRSSLKKHPGSFYLRRSYLFSIVPKWGGSYKKEYELASLMYNSGIGFGDYARAFFVRGKNYYKLKQYKKAIKSLTKAIKLESEWSDFYYWRASAFIKLEEYEKAANDLKLAHNLSPYDTDV